MIGQVQSLKIYLASTPVDMRKSFDSLAAVARDFLRLDPLSGNLFVFFNKKRDKVKVLYWGRTGYCLFYKRMERGRFKIPSYVDGEGASVEMDQVELNMLLDGIKIEKVKRGKTPWE